MTLWSAKKTRIFRKQSVSVTLTRFGTLVITRSIKYVVATSAFLLSCVKRWSPRLSIKASSLTLDALSMESQRMSGKLKSSEITILSNWSQTSCRKLSNASLQLGSSLGGLKQKRN